MGLEASVEATYPVDQAMGTSLIMASGQIFGVVFIAVSAAMEKNLLPEAALIQVNNII